jgi:hypothetical protein
MREIYNYENSLKYLMTNKANFDQKDALLRIPPFFAMDFHKRVKDFSLIIKNKENDKIIEFVCILNTSEVTTLFENLCNEIKVIESEFEKNLENFIVTKKSLFGEPKKVCILSSQILY